MGFSIFLQSNVTIKILVFTLKLKDRKTENYKTASGHHKVERRRRSVWYRFNSRRGHKTASGHHKVELSSSSMNVSLNLHISHKTASGHHKVEHGDIQTPCSQYVNVTKPQAVFTRSRATLTLNGSNALQNGNKTASGHHKVE